MQHVTRMEDANPSGPTIVAVGMFDGVHLGHQHLLTRLVEAARLGGYTPAVLTFFPHPDVVMGRAASERHYLMSPDDRAAMLGSLGIELVVTHPFDDTVRVIRAADFVDRMVAHLKLGELWVGADFALGYKREGDVEFLRQQGVSKGFRLRSIGLVGGESNDKIISSGAIRLALRAGDVARANTWLGRPYRMAGEVVHGDQRGRLIGFPTANIAVWDQLLLPANGVYAGWARLGDERFMAVANIGLRPTFDGQTITVEAYLLDFDREIHGEWLAFDAVERLRSEMRFPGVEALIAQIGQDVEQARALLAERAAPDGQTSQP